MTTETDPESPATEEDATSEQPLGAPGLAALQSERDARKASDKALADALAKIKQFEDKDKTDQQRADDELAATRAQIAELTAAKTRAEVAASKGVPAALLTGSTQEELEASADALIAFKGEKSQQRLIVPGEGKTPNPKETNAERFAALIEEKLS